MSDQVIEQLIGKINKLQDRISDLERREVLTEGEWTDYSSISTIVGWSSFTSKSIFYKQIGKMVLVTFVIEGTSNSTSTTFTLPYTANSLSGPQSIARVQDNGGTHVTGYCRVVAGSATVDIFPNIVGGVWTSSGTKTVRGQFCYIIN